MAVPLIFPPQMTFPQAFRMGLIAPKECAAYIHWMHELPCCVNNTQRAIHAHHLVGHGIKPVGGKTCDFLAMPLEAVEHGPGYAGSLHEGHETWEEKNGSQLEHALWTLLRAIHEGHLVWKP